MQEERTNGGQRSHWEGVMTLSKRAGEMPSKHAKVDAVDGTVREGRHFSPFLSTDDAPSAYERAKMVVMAPVAVVRIAAMSMVFLFLATVGWVATRGADVDRPYGSLRRLVVRCNVWACSCLALLIGGVWLRVEGRENVPPARRAKAIGVFNHLSYLDILILVYTFGATFIAKGGVDRIPLVGSVAKALQCIFVARAGTADRLAPSPLTSISPPPRRKAEPPSRCRQVKLRSVWGHHPHAGRASPRRALPSRVRRPRGHDADG